QLISTVVFNRAFEVIAKVIKSVDHIVCHGPQFQNNVTFQLFGVDIAINNKLQPQVMEFNIGPNLETFDARDKEVKYAVVEDIFKLLNIIPDADHNYIQII